MVSAHVPSSVAQPEGPPPAQVRFDEARLEQTPQRRDVTGDVRTVARADVAAEESGKVIELNVREGDRVEKGRVIARLDATLLELDLARGRAELAAARATVREREAQLERADRDLRRVQDLDREIGASPRELEDARTDVAVAQARLEEARARVTTAEAAIARLDARLEDMTIRAPFAGQVTRKRTEIGEWLSDGDEVVELVVIDTLDVVLDVPERFVGALSSSEASIAVRISATGSQVESSDFRVIASGDELARTFPVIVRIPNEDGVIKPGMSAIASVPTGVRAETLTVAKDALMRNAVGAFVYAEVNGTATPMPIDIVFATEQRLAIRPGAVQPGMRIVVEGNERLFPGQPLIEFGAGPGGPPEGAGMNAGGGEPGQQPADQARSGATREGS
jgi:RND family efflux transporter MFP subunit